MSKRAQARHRADPVALDLPERRYLPELHGLRGLAILGVVVFHLFGQGRISGGIDVFLAISGFLFTGMLLREAATRGRINAVAYVGRLARRLLPPALVVLAAVAVLGWWILPETQHAQLARELRATLLYFENWELINSQLAYGAAGPDSSPLQHFWSLSVQGQFYLIWPFVALLAVGLARWAGARASVAMGVLVALLLAGSLAFAMWLGSFDQEVAYLHTGTRMWELAFGALLALIGSGLLAQWPRVRVAAGWVGVALVVTCGLVLDGAALFPGPWALWPLLGMALVIWSTDSTSQWSAGRVLASRVMTHTGDLAYCLYLWHWPLLVFLLQWQDLNQIGWLHAAGLLALSWALAEATHRFVERPCARLSAVPVRSILAGATALAIGAIGTVAWSADLAERSDSTPEIATQAQEYPGAGATVADAPEPPDVEPVPEPIALAEDQPDYYDWPCRQERRNTPDSGEVLVCDDPRGAAVPEQAPTVMVAGGSHAGQWVPALRLLAEEHGWRVLIADKSSCQWSTPIAGQNESCLEWNENFPAMVRQEPPDVILTLGTSTLGEQEQMPEGFIEAWNTIADTGTQIVAIRDTPRFSYDVPECVGDATDISVCGIDRASIFQQPSPLAEIELPDHVTGIDLTDRICLEERCPAVVGNIVVYRDTSHLSTLYTESLAPFLDRHLRDAVPVLDESS